MRPGPQDGRRWRWWSEVGSRFTHQGPIRGPHRIPDVTPRDGRNPAGSGWRAQDRRVMSDACSPGEVGAISCPVAGRARKGAGRRRPDTPQYDSLIRVTPDPSRALHVRPWDRNALGRVGCPRAGRVSEGRTRGTRKPGVHGPERTLSVTAAASNGKPSCPG